jgi:hypothetical protein
MTWIRPFFLALAFALAVQAGLYFLLAALGASSELASAVEVIWLVVAVFMAVTFVDL